MIKFSITESQVITFIKMVAKRNARGQTKNRLILSVLISIASACLIQYKDPELSLLGTWAIFFPLLVGVWYLILSKLHKENQAKSAKSTAAEFGEPSLEINTNGIHVIFPTSETTFSWSGITDYTIDNGLIVLWLSKTRGIMIPEDVLVQHDLMPVLEDILKSNNVHPTA
jgi:hypothetical protein